MEAFYTPNHERRERRRLHSTMSNFLNLMVIPIQMYEE